MEKEDEDEEVVVENAALVAYPTGKVRWRMRGRLKPRRVDLRGSDENGRSRRRNKFSRN